MMEQAPATVLDVVPVAPKDRFETIMAAWHSLPADGVLELNMDHDPSCMYYTLRATQGEDAFTFEYIERGPLFWRVRVTRRAA
jgi:regulator of cell morphogenesis and NO signaling